MGLGEMENDHQGEFLFQVTAVTAAQLYRSVKKPLTCTLKRSLLGLAAQNQNLMGDKPGNLSRNILSLLPQTHKAKCDWRRKKALPPI